MIHELQAPAEARDPCCSSCRRRPTCTDFDRYLAHWLDENRFKAVDGEVPVGIAAYVGGLVACDNYDSVFIRYPITVEAIVTDTSFDARGEQERVGAPVAVKVGVDGFDADLHVGIYLGRLPYSVISEYDAETKVLSNGFTTNPAVYVPAFGRIFYGAGIMWRFLERPEDLMLITEADRETPTFTYAEVALRRPKAY